MAVSSTSVNIIPKKMIKIIKRSPNTSNSPADKKPSISPEGPDIPSDEGNLVSKKTLPLKSINFVNSQN